MVISIYAVSKTVPTAVLVIGLNSHAIYNAPLQSFFNLLANQMGKGLLAVTVSPPSPLLVVVPLFEVYF